MILPLHHCMAICCLELIDEPELMCRKHWSMLKHETMAPLVAPRDAAEFEQVSAVALIEVAMAEGRIKKFPAPDASQANSTPPVSPSAAGNQEPQP